MAFCENCETCAFADWDITLFRDGKTTPISPIHPYPPYNEQSDIYCKKKNKFLLETEMPFECKDREYGENNYADACQKFYHQRQEYLEEFKSQNGQ